MITTKGKAVLQCMRA